ncbi:MAG TPA: phosphatase PAP2-related protein [Chitinophagaceae bacterium]|nr:phosphatase PAP2-related protein [Chitinophagaceae bacterium]
MNRPGEYYAYKPRFLGIIRQRWQESMSIRGFTIRLWMTIVYLTCLVVFMNNYFNYIQARQGIVLNDFLLSLFHPVNLSLEIFSVIYISIITGIFFLLMVPDYLLRAIEAASIIYSLRILTLYFVKLDPPAGFIPLTDPFMLHFVYDGRMITKDLFFSGHTASLMLLVLATDRKGLKVFFTLALSAVILMLLWQRVHYTIDIVGALFFTALAWKITGLWRHKGSLNSKTGIPGYFQ